jgi:hypothetical protein
MHGIEMHGIERHGIEMHGIERHGIEMHGIERHGIDMHGIERHGIERHGIERHVTGSHGFRGPTPAIVLSKRLIAEGAIIRHEEKEAPYQHQLRFVPWPCHHMSPSVLCMRMVRMCERE